LTPEISDLIKNSDTTKVYVSKESFPTSDELGKLMDSVDIGIALYQQIPGSITLGNNLKYLGMSSGKIATYLQHGIPVIINEIGEMSEFVRNQNLGFVVRGPEEISGCLKEFQPDELKDNCYAFFDDVLNLDLTIHPLLDKIDEVIKNFNRGE
jgi:hypothetical protein